MLGLHGFPDSVGIQSRPRTGLVSRRLRRATSSAQALHLPRASRQAVCDPDGIRYGSSSRSATVDAPRRRSLLRSHPDSSADAATPLASARHSTSPRASPPMKLAFALLAERAVRRARSRAPPPASHAVPPGPESVATISRNDCVVLALLNPACSSLRHGSASSQDGFPS